MGFLRVVELFPPLLHSSEHTPEPPSIEGRLDKFLEGARGVSDCADLFLVANLKNPTLLKFSALEAAFLLKDRVGVRAAPVIVLRDMNRPHFLSTALTAITLELDSIMVAWGDKYPPSARSSNVRDFRSVSAALREIEGIRGHAHSEIRLLAPVNVERLADPAGIRLAKSRLNSGADLLLAQPPTTDDETLERHSRLLAKSRLKQKVLLNVFPFRNARDVAECERYFGWKLPRALHKTATLGEAALVEAGRSVVRRLRAEGFPGVYFSTRGDPDAARKFLR